MPEFTQPAQIENIKHWLDKTGSEIIMPTEIFKEHAKVKAGLLEWRKVFIKAISKRNLKSGVR